MVLALVCTVGYFLIFAIPQPQDLYGISLTTTVIFAGLGFGNLKMSLSIKDKILPMLCIIAACTMLHTFITIAEQF